MNTVNDRITHIIKNNILLREAYIRKHGEFRRAYDIATELFEKHHSSGDKDVLLQKLLNYFEGRTDPLRAAEELYNSSDTLKSIYNNSNDFIEAYQKLPVDNTTKLEELQAEQTKWDAELKRSKRETENTEPAILEIPLQQRFAIAQT